MIRFMTKEDGAAVAPLILVILKDMELPFVAQHGEALTIKLLTEAIADPTYRYGYTKGIVKEVAGKIAGVAFGYTSEEEPTIDAPWTKILAAHGLDETSQLFTDPETFPDEWYLDTICVAEEFRGKGIGSDLLDALPMIAARDGKSVIGLSVDEANPGARRLYTRKGFKKVGEVPISGHLYDHMQKDISSELTIE
ncbi:GNAT family acetyltransferase [Enterococcus sp. JM4C]|uniref:GNAT family N-acetyltransferase n=1 Tax=Candidatus Enterococcus huntleyi TaxID=1857217 RepID=UPI00137A6294|nr:N-acetyltransferase [Enterococcus sp. JM4C]KAF1295658.1 GNAT family acetyltransferase [Enterococcus sp. JM4C]